MLHPGQECHFATIVDEFARAGTIEFHAGSQVFVAQMREVTVASGHTYRVESYSVGAGYRYNKRCEHHLAVASRIDRTRINSNSHRKTVAVRAKTINIYIGHFKKMSVGGKHGLGGRSEQHTGKQTYDIIMFHSCKREVRMCILSQ